MKPVMAPITKYLYSKASYQVLPISGTFELSPECNFACRMCYVRKTHAEVLAAARPMLTLAQWLEIAEWARNQGMLYLLLTGGEPLLWPDFWELYRKLSRMGFIISINTNGSMIDDEAIQRFQEYPPARVNITLYGANDESYKALCRAKGVYTKVTEAILKLKNAGINVKLNCSLTPFNIGDLPEMARFAVENKLILMATPYMFPPVRRNADMIGENERFTPEECARYNLERIRLQYPEAFYRNYLSEIRNGKTDPMGLDESCYDPVDGRVRCRAGRAAFWVTWDGWMLPCGMMPEPKTDLVQLGFDEAWKRTVEKTAGIRLSGLCVKCENQEMCHACAAMAYAETGTFEGVPKYLCRMVQETKGLVSRLTEE